MLVFLAKSADFVFTVLIHILFYHTSDTKLKQKNEHRNSWSILICKQLWKIFKISSENLSQCMCICTYILCSLWNLKVLYCISVFKPQYFMYFSLLTWYNFVRHFFYLCIWIFCLLTGIFATIFVIERFGRKHTMAVQFVIFSACVCVLFICTKK